MTEQFKTELVPETPPTVERANSNKFRPELEQVMGTPEQWFRIASGDLKKAHAEAQGLRTKARNDRLPGQDDGEWSFTVRKLPDAGDDMGGLWAMYIPKKK